MSHAPATSHGAYIRVSQDGLEDLEDYERAVITPVHLGDILDGDNRYRVVDKLGLGGYGTVWLCRDTLQSKYVAVKICIGKVDSADMMGVYLEKLDRTTQGAEFVGGHFSLERPNGTQCLVLPLLGPRVSLSLWLRKSGSDSMLKKICRQAIQGMEYLHKDGIFYGAVPWAQTRGPVGQRGQESPSHVRG